MESRKSYKTIIDYAYYLGNSELMIKHYSNDYYDWEQLKLQSIESLQEKINDIPTTEQRIVFLINFLEKIFTAGNYALMKAALSCSVGDSTFTINRAILTERREEAMSLGMGEDFVKHLDGSWAEYFFDPTVYHFAKEYSQIIVELCFELSKQCVMLPEDLCFDKILFFYTTREDIDIHFKYLRFDNTIKEKGVINNIPIDFTLIEPEKKEYLLKSAFNSFDMLINDKYITSVPRILNILKTVSPPLLDNNDLWINNKSAARVFFSTLIEKGFTVTDSYRKAGTVFENLFGVKSSSIEDKPTLKGGGIPKAVTIYKEQFEEELEIIISDLKLK